MTKVEFATQWMENLANDNSHGYSQANRWGPDYDCSSSIIQAWEEAGVPVKSKGASYTGNMYDAFMACGFQDVTSQVNRSNGGSMMRGDVLLNHASHTAMVTAPGRVVHARSSEGNSMPGDQSGNEIREQSYWNYPWDKVLRYFDIEEEPQTPEQEQAQENQTLLDKIKDLLKPSETQPISKPVSAVKQMPGMYPLLTNNLRNERREDVKAFQTLYNLRFPDRKIQVDGCYKSNQDEGGNGTVEACLYAQKEYGLLADGECGRDTWAALINGK